MREILFRGKRVDNGKWVKGSLFVEGARCEIVRGTCNTVGIEGVDIISETVGQFTGLTDKNGKKIFEGDIIAYQFYDEERIDGVVKYGAFNCSCCDGVFGWYVDGGDIRRQKAEDECVSDNYVIGNIFDNPKLLKGGAE